MTLPLPTTCRRFPTIRKSTFFTGSGAALQPHPDDHNIGSIKQTAKSEDFFETLEQVADLIVNDHVTEVLTGNVNYSDNQFDPKLARRAGRKNLNCSLWQAVVVQFGTAAA